MDTPPANQEISLDLINALLDDWHKPGMSELDLCRAHQISLETLEAAPDQAARDRWLSTEAIPSSVKQL